MVGLYPGHSRLHPDGEHLSAGFYVHPPIAPESIEPALEWRGLPGTTAEHLGDTSITLTSGETIPVSIVEVTTEWRREGGIEWPRPEDNTFDEPGKRARHRLVDAATAITMQNAAPGESTHYGELGRGWIRYADQDTLDALVDARHGSGEHEYTNWRHKVRNLGWLDMGAAERLYHEFAQYRDRSLGALGIAS
jgi:hypothetical protein